MADLLGYVDNLSVHCLLLGGQTLELGSKLVDQLTKSFANLGLGCYTALYETIEVAFGLWRLRRWIVW